MTGSLRLLQGDVLERLADLEDESIQCAVTSPPYWGLRDYGSNGQLGLEDTPEEHVARMVEVFREVRRVLRSDGTLWLNYGDSYNAYNANRGASTGFSDGASGRDHPSAVRGLRTDSLKPKDLVGMPWRIAFALQADGWWLRSDIIWHKPNPMPESVTDRPTKSHEYVFLLTKSARYYYDADAVREKGIIPAGTLAAKGSTERSEMPGVNSRPREYKEYDGQRNLRDVWTITTHPFPDAHFATFPPKLVEPCIKAGCDACGTVLDPFIGSGTTAIVACGLGRDCIGIELNPEYAAMAEKRYRDHFGLFARVL